MNTPTPWMIALALLLALAAPARAGVIGGTCVPDSDTIARQLYHTAGFGVQFAPGKVGRIRFLCPLPGTGTSNMSGILLSYIDPDGVGTEAHVVASLRFALSGSNAGITIGSCDSNSNTANVTGPAEVRCLFPRHDVRAAYYWWEIVMERTNPALNVEFLGSTYLITSGNMPWPWSLF
jgi:hypothetical protein